MSLRNKLIRLAYEKPELRKEILPLLKTADWRLLASIRASTERWIYEVQGRGKRVYLEKVKDGLAGKVKTRYWQDQLFDPRNEEDEYWELEAIEKELKEGLIKATDWQRNVIKKIEVDFARQKQGWAVFKITVDRSIL